MGKNAQGVVDPVQLPTQKGRRGLGFTSREPRESFVLDWDPEQKEVNLYYVGNFISTYFIFSIQYLVHRNYTSNRLVTK